jgi:hypothetical protein
MRTGLGCKLIETLNELNVHNYDSLTGSSMNTSDSFIKESKIDTTVHTYRAVLKILGSLYTHQVDGVCPLNTKAPNRFTEKYKNL